jgi:hypothetical protein
MTTPAHSGADTRQQPCGRSDGADGGWELRRAQKRTSDSR